MGTLAAFSTLPVRSRELTDGRHSVRTVSGNFAQLKRCIEHLDVRPKKPPFFRAEAPVLMKLAVIECYAWLF
jgi:hypothetical protein